VTESVRAGVAASSALRLWLCCVATAFLALSLAGITTSSLGIPYLSVERGRDATGVVLGTPRAIRSDEYFRATPWLLGLMERGDDGFASPLAFADVALAAPTARDVPSALLHWEAVAAKAAAALPDSLVFAAIWWFPVALVAALLPLWLTRLGARPDIAIATTALVLLAPVNHWWSWGPIGVLTAPLLGGLLVLVGLDRWRFSGANVLSLGAWALASLCVAKSGLGYAPWAIPLTAAVFLPTLVAALRSGGRRLTLVVLGSVFVAGVVLAGALTASSGAVDVIADTVYPGGRRSIGEFVGWALLFGAPHVWILQAGPEIARGTNESELTAVTSCSRSLPQRSPPLSAGVTRPFAGPSSPWAPSCCAASRGSWSTGPRRSVASSCR